MPIEAQPEQTAEKLRTAAEAAEMHARNAIERLRTQKDAVVDRMRPKLDAVTTYVKDEPTKSMLGAAAVGAGIMALIVLMTRSGSRRRVVPSSTLSTIRDAALDLADRAHVAANDALKAAQGRTHGLFSSAEKHADRAFAAAQKRSDAAHALARERAAEASERAQTLGEDAIAAARQKAADVEGAAATALHDAWDSVREHADPVIERYRPQIENALRYAKDDPAKAALGAAAAGAVLIGLLALLRPRDS